MKNILRLIAVLGASILLLFILAGCSVRFGGSDFMYGSVWGIWCYIIARWIFE